MNILWLINIPLPEASMLMKEKPIPFGGWLVNTSNVLSEQKDINLTVAFPKNGIKEIQCLKGEKIKFYAFSTINEKDIYSNSRKTQFEEMLEKIKPDIVHVFGTEFPHTFTMINVCKRLNIETIISIQGLVSILSKHYMASLPNSTQRRFTFRDFIKQDNIRQQQKKFANRGLFEIEALKMVNHVIGRTDWDKACTSQINPSLKYHYCNETLREEFYNNIWNLKECEQYSIFVSQAAYPIKGLHYMIEAMTLILKRFNKAKLYIAGPEITKNNTIKEKLKMGSYAKYIKDLIIKYDLSGKVIFTGILDEKKMCERFLKSNVFVSPSSIENESNSLSEAKILGVPCVASYVGGVTNRINNGIDGFLYQADAPYMLAHYVCEIFGNEKLAQNFSNNARNSALKLHDREENLKTLLNIYNEVFKSKNV